jgi:hypothetical protein
MSIVKNMILRPGVRGDCRLSRQYEHTVTVTGAWFQDRIGGGGGGVFGSSTSLLSFTHLSVLLFLHTSGAWRIQAPTHDIYLPSQPDHRAPEELFFPNHVLFFFSPLFLRQSRQTSLLLFFLNRIHFMPVVVNTSFPRAP